ncbi:hypothetical protein SAMN05216548_10430 [Faunimonas pinastri]|uniref:Uncharacterized protein n=1 Tax=Faunimonas pinastri TaxID=1855383 RepID=A0A1H9F7V6_9HYPH|nr:hypothetical protein [Faunimonas pinastri]SEQ34040.1 hypothetical protein SAMN05216548_10430 [Faunimonas pinastri]
MAALGYDLAIGTIFLVTIALALVSLSLSRSEVVAATGPRNPFHTPRPGHNRSTQ